MDLAAWLRRIATPFAPPMCFGCGAAGDGEPLCARCRGALAWMPPEPFELEGSGGVVAAWAPLAYRGGARALVRALKFRGALHVAGTMAAQIAANAPEGLWRDAALVPAPLHRARLRRRGFNQAERLASELAPRVGSRVVDCLARGGARGTQMGRDRDERLSSLAGAIAVRPGSAPPNRAIVIDDVMTTGATAIACADALHRAGSEVVASVAYARTPGR